MSIYCNHPPSYLLFSHPIILLLSKFLKIVLSESTCITLSLHRTGISHTFPIAWTSNSELISHGLQDKVQPLSLAFSYSMCTSIPLIPLAPWNHWLHWVIFLVLSATAPQWVHLLPRKLLSVLAIVLIPRLSFLRVRHVLLCQVPL